MKQYECTYLTAPDATEEETKSLQDKLAASIQAKSGTVDEFQRAFKRRLAYPVNKHEIAYVNTLIFQMEAKDLEAFKKELKEEPKILRNLLLVYKPLTQKEPTRLRTRLRKAQESAAAAEEEQKAKKEKPKAELNDIEEKLEEILHEE
jgi:ribosomal protein S6